MKIGIDFHGVIDIYPEIFSKLTKKWKDKGFEIHIITGKEWKDIRHDIDKFNIAYTNYYSIVDHHQSLGTKMEKKPNGWWMPDNTWNKSKGEYCTKEGISLHFDNDITYAPSFPACCTFIWVRENNFEVFIEAIKF